MNRKIILIGGMPTAGKTTISREVAKHYDLPSISTDQIRTIMESIADKTKYPLLFTTEGMNAETFLTTYTAEQIADMEYEQGREVWHGIKAFIERDWVWRNGCVIEGVAILPLLARELQNNNPNVKAVFVSDNNHNRITHTIYNRGLYDDANNYSDDVKHKEVEWVKLFDQKLRSDAVENNYAIIDINKNDSDIQNVIQALSS